jgi:hypothetical protein
MNRFEVGQELGECGRHGAWFGTPHCPRCPDFYEGVAHAIGTLLRYPRDKASNTAWAEQLTRDLMPKGVTVTAVDRKGGTITVTSR